jgi:hypothetical protein
MMCDNVISDRFKLNDKHVEDRFFDMFEQRDYKARLVFQLIGSKLLTLCSSTFDLTDESLGKDHPIYFQRFNADDKRTDVGRMRRTSDEHS